MEIREAVPSDIPDIIKVLKASLGEVDLPLSEEIWNFKHIINPFGNSPVFVAEEGGKVAGVRAFMRWKWQKGQNEFSSYRAVDTATHPDFQGRGIFKKLTLKAVDIGKTQGDDFIFNTPNDQSRPGYLKMGWEEAGKISVGVQPFFRSLFKLPKNVPPYGLAISVSDDDIEKLCVDWNQRLIERHILFTPKSRKYLEWRYEKNPLQKYFVIAESGYYLACYVKKRKWINELRIVECIFSPQPLIEKALQKNIKKIASKVRAQVITYSPKVAFPDTMGIKGDFGPILTVRKLDLQKDDYSNLRNLGNWGYSLGDLELF